MYSGNNVETIREFTMTKSDNGAVRRRHRHIFFFLELSLFLMRD